MYQLKYYNILAANCFSANIIIAEAIEFLRGLVEDIGLPYEIIEVKQLFNDGTLIKHAINADFMLM